MYPKAAYQSLKHQSPFLVLGIAIGFEFPRNFFQADLYLKYKAHRLFLVSEASFDTLVC